MYIQRRSCNGNSCSDSGGVSFPLKGGTNGGGRWTTERSESADDDSGRVSRSWCAARRCRPLTAADMGVRAAGICRSVSLAMCRRPTSYDAAAAASGARGSRRCVRLQNRHDGGGGSLYRLTETRAVLVRLVGEVSAVGWCRYVSAVSPSRARAAIVACRWSRAQLTLMVVGRAGRAHCLLPHASRGVGRRPTNRGDRR